MPPIENRQEEQRNKNWSPANALRVGSGEFSLHDLNSVEKSGPLRNKEVAQLRLDSVIIEYLLFFVNLNQDFQDLRIYRMPLNP